MWVIETKHNFKRMGWEDKQKYPIGSPDSKRESDLCMFFLKIILHIFAILLCVYIEDHIGN